ncbi:putative protein kinase RLK-Pelle-DLSV family [Helianthus annuus]|nr:putative protein kinase RLK-Pelle-DLSV family [Helianthus annuus]
MFIFAGKLLLWLLSFIFIFLINTSTLAQPGDLSFSCGGGNYSVNSTYQRNLDATLSALPTTNNGFGFYNLSTGLGSDRVNSVALCRGDVNHDACRSCLNRSIVELPQFCRSNQKQAMVYYDICFLVYSNSSILGTTQMDSHGYMFRNKLENVTHDIDQFNDVLGSLLNDLIGETAAGDSLLKFRSGERKGPGFYTIYALMQCLPSLSDQQCRDCLENSITISPRLFEGSDGVRILRPTCNIRYEIYRFFNESPQVINPPPRFFNESPQVINPPPPGKKNDSTRTVIIIIVVIVIAIIIIIASFSIFIRLRKKKKNQTTPPNAESLDGNGYMAPEYALHGQFSMKSNVFSFGVLVLEMVAGQKNKRFQNGENIEYLLGFAWSSWRNGTATDIIDPTLKTESCSLDDIIKIIQIGLLCVQENVSDRPTMASIIHMLNSFTTITLPVPAEPAFFMHTNNDPEMPLLHEYSSSSGSQSQSRVSRHSINDVSVSTFVPR